MSLVCQAGEKHTVPNKDLMNIEPTSLTSTINQLAEDVRVHFSEKYQVREPALKLCRDAIRFSANAIRAIHRGESGRAGELLASSKELLQQVESTLCDHPDVYHAGFVADAQKEFAESAITRALVQGNDLPSPEELGVPFAPYLNGLGEAVGELRRHLLDRLRRGETDGCERLLSTMDELYNLLVTVDFPDSLTRGLRRTTDMVRGVLERTRGDATLASIESRLSARLEALEGGSNSSSKKGRKLTGKAHEGGRE